MEEETEIRVERVVVFLVLEACRDEVPGKDVEVEKSAFIEIVVSGDLRGTATP